MTTEELITALCYKVDEVRRESALEECR